MSDPRSPGSRAEAVFGEPRAIAFALAAALCGGISTDIGGEARARTFAARATAQDAGVVSASTLALQALVARAEKLWPAHPALIAEYERWLSEARELIEGRAADASLKLVRRPGLAEYQSALAKLRSRALPLTPAQVAADRESHPQAAELNEKRAQATWLSRMLKLEKFPAEADVEAQLAKRALPGAVKELNRLAWISIDPDRPKCGEELEALLVARRALDAATPAEEPEVRLSLAWAHFRLGQMEDATAQLQAALEEAPSEQQKDLERQLGRLAHAIARWTGEAQLAQRRKQRDSLSLEIANLDRIVGERRTWSFEHAEDGRAQAELSKLVAGLESLCDSRGGLMGDTLAAPFGWGISKRLQFAKTIQERSVDGSLARQRWRAATDAIASSPWYGGLGLAPQIGLAPIGENPDTHLWEFAQLQTGTPAERAVDGRLSLSEDTGLVFVLIPGGTFAMGSQSAQPAAANFDPLSAGVEAPAHAVTLAPYFLSKFEMTQGQWQRICGVNPSENEAGLDIAAEPSNLLHPVESVSWTECAQAMEHLGLSLPSEAQWEWAARATTSTSWWTGQDPESLRGNVNIADATAAEAGEAWSAIRDWPDFADGWVLHAPVGTFPPNRFGLHEVHGNVDEWCLDGYDEHFYAKSPAREPLSPATGAALRVIRGGSFESTAACARCAARRGAPPETHDSALGLRPARALAP